jgi:hypothetical protein
MSTFFSSGWHLRARGPLSQGGRAGGKALRIRHADGMGVRRKRPRGVQVGPLNPHISFSLAGTAPPTGRRSGRGRGPAAARAGRAAASGPLSWGVGARHYRPIQTLGTPNLLGA